MTQSISTKREITEAANRLGIDINELDARRAEAIREELLAKYGADTSYELNCNNLKNYAAVQHPDSWMWVKEYISDEPLYFFYDSHDEKTIFLVHKGSDVYRILEESYAFVFYLASESMSYLICHNDHEYLLGAGDARPWVESLRPRHTEWAAQLAKKTDS